MDINITCYGSPEDPELNLPNSDLLEACFVVQQVAQATYVTITVLANDMSFEQLAELRVERNMGNVYLDEINGVDITYRQPKVDKADFWPSTIRDWLKVDPAHHSDY